MKIAKSTSRLKTQISSFSKSYSNRALILAAQNPKEVTIHNISDSDDTQFLIKGLMSLGIKIKKIDNTIIVENSIYDLAFEKPIDVSLGAGGTTIRFFLFLTCLVDCEIKIKCNSEFFKRPIDSYILLLSDLGAQIFIKDEIIYKKGKITPRHISIDASQTTQFASAALLCMKKEYVSVEKMDSSFKYLEMTLDLLEQRNATEFTVPVDMSSLSYLIAYGLIINDIHIKNVKTIDYSQADSYLVTLLKEADFQYSLDDEGLEILKADRLSRSLVVDGAQCLDLIATLCFIFSYIPGDFKIFNIKNLVHKESNRLDGILKILRHFKITNTYNENKDELHIVGSDKRIDLANDSLDVEPDHRMAMVGVLFLMANNGGEINNVESISKSYKNFFKDLKII